MKSIAPEPANLNRPTNELTAAFIELVRRSHPDFDHGKTLERPDAVDGARAAVVALRTFYTTAKTWLSSYPLRNTCERIWWRKQYVSMGFVFAACLFLGIAVYYKPGDYEFFAKIKKNALGRRLIQGVMGEGNWEQARTLVRSER